jgi:tetratricopeptide (TPR) repeat protein
VEFYFSARSLRARRVLAGAICVLLVSFFAVTYAVAQEQTETPAFTPVLAPGSSTAVQAADRGRILLVLPFDNRSGQPNLEWVREAAADLLSSRFRSVGFAPTRRADRMYALDHLGLPQSFQPSRASSLKLAQTLDADQIVVGSFIIDGNDIVAQAKLVDVPHLRMGKQVTARGDMHDMIAVFDSLAWKLTMQLDPNVGVSEETFIAAGKNLRIDAFEQYIRGITESDQVERLKHLEASVKLNPNFSPAWMALGREQYNGQQYEQAADAFARVDKSSIDGLEAGFYRGLSLLFSGDYANAEKAFADVAKVLPLAEVINNEAVAASRQGHDATTLFVQAAADDPSSPDYHFNLAVSLKRHGQPGPAMNELAQCLKLRPNDSEAQALMAAWKQPVVRTVSQTAGAPAADSDSVAEPDPLERIVRTFDASAFRQAAQMLDQVETARLSALPPMERAQKLSAQARSYFDSGLLLEAERFYQSAVRADNNCAEAHEGLALVRERTGAVDAARREANKALELKPSASAYLVLGRLDLDAGRLTEAGNEATEALKLEPANVAAGDLAKKVQTKAGETK